MLEELVLVIWVGEFITWWQPDVDVKSTNYRPWKWVVSWDHLFLDLALKSPVMIEANSFSSLISFS